MLNHINQRDKNGEKSGNAAGAQEFASPLWASGEPFTPSDVRGQTRSWGHREMEADTPSHQQGAGTPPPQHAAGWEDDVISLRALSLP